MKGNRCAILPQNLHRQIRFYGRIAWELDQFALLLCNCEISMQFVGDFAIAYTEGFEGDVVMYCRNCKGQINQGAAFCTLCGAPVGAGRSFCPNCGESTDPMAVICVKCGIQLAPLGPQPNPIGSKSKLTAGLLGIFLGSYGVHNFYLGYIKKAVIQLSASVLSMILYFVGIFWQMDNIFSYNVNNMIGSQGYRENATPYFNFSGFFITIIIFLIVTLGIRAWTIVESVFILSGKTTVDAKGNPIVG